MVESRVSEGSPILSEEVSGSEHGGASKQPNVAGMLPSELAENNMPHLCGYEWASTLVTTRFSRYRWSSMVNTYAAVVPMFTTGKTSPELLLSVVHPCIMCAMGERLTTMISFISSLVCSLILSFAFLSMNSLWASLQAFRLLAEMFRLRPSPHVFLSFYSTRPSSPVKWVSLVSQSPNVLFTPFSSSYKYFKDSFFKIIITPADRHHFFDGDNAKFPLYWTRDPVHYLSWLRSPMTEDDKKMFDIMNQLPRKLNVRSILKLYLSSHRWVDLSGMFVFFYDIMVSVFNPAEFSFFLIGIMAQ